MRGEGPEFGFSCRQSEPLAYVEIVGVVKTGKNKVPIVCHQHLAVALEVAPDLLTFNDGHYLLVGGFDLNRTARWKLTFDQFALGSLLELIGSKQASVRNSPALVRKINNASDPGLESLADFVEEIVERSVIGRLLHS